ncbi:MAG: hypothetical protein IJV66_02210 [Firmicutes bacterium]|nr:hypothetical protein [Bacillota bacterium]
MAYYGKINTVSIPKKNDEGRPLFMGDYVYWVTASHRDPVTHRSVDDRKTIGRIADDLKTLMWPNKNYDLIFGDPSKGDCRTHEQMLAAGPYLAASKAADKMGVMSALKKAFPAEWAKIFALCVQWIDMEEHVSQCFEYWFYDNYCGFFTPMDPSNISRLYEAIGVNPIQRDLYRKSFNERYRKQFTETSAGNKKMKKKRIIGCDGTNNNHSSKENELAGFGKAKDDPDKPIYGTMSYVDEDTGVTLFTHLFPGSLLDKTEFTYALEKSMCLGIRDLHLMFDRGFLSEKFLTFFIAIKEQYNITFSASCPATYGFVKEMIQKYGKELQNADKYYIPEENVYGMKIDDTVQINGNGITGKDMEGLTLYLFYDEKRAEGERTAIQDKVSHFQMMLEQRKRYTEKHV